MLMSNEFVKAEDNYRRDLLRDHYRSAPTAMVGKVVAVLVVVGALLLAACGDPSESEPGAGETTPIDVISEQDSARDVTVPAGEETSPEEEFSGVPAPDWDPKHGRLPVVERADKTSGPR